VLSIGTSPSAAADGHGAQSGDSRGRGTARQSRPGASPQRRRGDVYATWLAELAEARGVEKVELDLGGAREGALDLTR
jgi:hypothetical protein